MSHTRFTRRLLHAIRTGDIDAARFFIRRGADLAWCDEWRNRSMLHVALRHHLRAAEWVSLLLAAGTPIFEPAYSGGETVAYLAARNGDLESLRLLGEVGAEMRGDCFWRSPLLIAVCTERLDCVEYLLSSGMSVHGLRRQEWQGMRHPLWHAVIHRSHPIATALLKAGVEQEVLKSVASHAQSWARNQEDPGRQRKMNRIVHLLDEALRQSQSEVLSRSGR